ncbi:hypothetical protein FB567DRAFT_520127, partial [Paraphoma chrysanthemicola]
MKRSVRALRPAVQLTCLCDTSLGLAHGDCAGRMRLSIPRVCHTTPLLAYRSCPCTSGHLCYPALTSGKVSPWGHTLMILGSPPCGAVQPHQPTRTA